MPLPPRQGLYDPAHEKDACGLGFVASLDRRASHDVVRQALEILANLTHRGAAGCDPCTGDGAGILLQIPHDLYRDAAPAAFGGALPGRGDYAVAMCFLAPEPARRRRMEAILEGAVLHHGQRVLGWRDVPIDAGAIGPLARASMPAIRQLFIGRSAAASRDDFERVLFMIRKRAGRTASVTLGGDDFYVSSCSSKTIVYKGLMLAEQVAAFYPDLADPRTVSRLAMVHSRFSTNTFPTWERAHPFRYLAHNGEINTLNGNRAWMRAREAMLESPLFGEHIEDFKPIIRPGGSDSASMDNVVDFLVASGRSLPHVMMMLVPEAFADASGEGVSPDMSPEKKAFYEYHGCLIEPWDGPAALTFTDGDLIGAMLDRNGLRPAKYVVTADGLVILASELGVLDLDPARVTQKGRVQPGKMFLVDTREGRLISDEEIKHRVATQRPYRAWLDENKIDLAELPAVKSPYSLSPADVRRLEQVFGYTEEDHKMILAPMAVGGEEPVGSMGVDIPLAALSDRPQLLFRYFKQQFAQVTNPPIDPIREEIVMSMVSCVGGEGNLLDETPRQCRMLQLPHPILTNDDLAKLRKNMLSDFRSCTIAMRFRKPEPGSDRTAGDLLQEALDQMAREAKAAIDAGASILILSDRDVGPDWVPIPSLLATAALHHRLIHHGRRMKAGIIVESGEPREVQHLALLVGFGAGAVNPYLALETVAEMARDGSLPKPIGEEKAIAQYVKALRKGLLKTMSKMGISAVASYQGAQIFEAIGIDQVVIDRYFTGTSSRIRGLGLEEIADEQLQRHRRAYTPGANLTKLDVGGHMHFRVMGEPHLWTPTTITNLQNAVRTGKHESYESYAREVNLQNAGGYAAAGQNAGGSVAAGQARRLMTLRGAWDLVSPSGRSIPIDEVEPATLIARRFATGAMSFGSISREAHETLALAMNTLGGRSNTGEGGEDPERFKDQRRSSIKQVASGRFGVTAEYLVNADEIQIKMAQGAKPGEGGQLPG
ncbi:MAG: glutamate synthase subunit alpha, partial [Deltaproteobacteria bacterium]|nr:glutamate synthase subunit alpha [Deltaproteobacteria bacterium]